jgi:DNA repair ATPase RecN
MENKLNIILAEVSAGELIDKITILEIKKIKITDNAKLADVEKELFSLSQTVKKYIPDESKISEYKDQLVKINTKLWNLENAKRAAEKTGEFGEKFINDARSVYKLNDERAKSKLAINEILCSNIKEVKSHN